MSPRPRRSLQLRKALFVLPNLFTFSSIFCGFYAVLLCATTDAANSTQENAFVFHRAALLIIFAMFFDTVDGRVARLTKTQSAFGVQIDSLADVCSFGVAPALLAYRWALAPLDTFGVAVAFIYLACASTRLARFNVLATTETGAPKKPGKYILGLPTPGAAGILVSLVVAQAEIATPRLPGPNAPGFVAAVVLGLSALMVSTAKFRSFKDIQLNARVVGLVAAVLASSVVIALTFHISYSLVFILACYVALAFAESTVAAATKIRTSVRTRRTSKTPTSDSTEDSTTNE